VELQSAATQIAVELHCIHARALREGNENPKEEEEEEGKPELCRGLSLISVLL